jgi:hypothetical protein
MGSDGEGLLRQLVRGAADESGDLWIIGRH